MKQILIIGIALILFGCDAPTDYKNKATELPEGRYRVVCMDGVKYYEGHNILTVAYGVDKQVVLCKD